MLKEAYHPNAYLANIKNIRLGLSARTKILNVLDKGSANVKTIAKETGMLYGVIMHHLRLLEAEGIVKRKGSKPYVWGVTGLGQKRLVN
ncbi:MAG: ArsR family transcriptional regulator [Candidatus Bathycorpusculaceae bacterium]